MERKGIGVEFQDPNPNDFYYLLSFLPLSLAFKLLVLILLVVLNIVVAVALPDFASFSYLLRILDQAALQEFLPVLLQG